MATFDELVANVKLITNRPDLDAETKHAVKVATLKAHQSDFYPKDIWETTLLWDPIAYKQSLDYRKIQPRYRAFKHLRKYDAVGDAPGKFFDIISPENSLDDYQINKEDVCYLAGEMIEIRSSTQDTYMLFGCYLNPVIDENNFSSWIALDHQFVIEFEAAAKIFKQIGWDEQAAALRQEVAEQYALLKQSNLLLQGY